MYIYIFLVLVSMPHVSPILNQDQQNKLKFSIKKKVTIFSQAQSVTSPSNGAFYLNNLLVDDTHGQDTSANPTLDRKA